LHYGSQVEMQCDGNTERFRTLTSYYLINR